MNQYDRMPSDHPVATCWTCKRLTEHAAAFQVRPGAYKAWKESLTTQLWVAAFVAVVVAFLAGAIGLGSGLLQGNTASRTADISAGAFILTLGASFSVMSSFIWLNMSEKLRVLQAERAAERN